MAREDYWEKISRRIASVVESRRIEHLLHFTRLECLSSILEKGIGTRSDLVNADLYPSDGHRMDDEDDAVSVSISCYYPKMFEGKRHGAPSQPWAILKLQPSILWNYRCHFYRRGAATRASQNENSVRHGDFALQKLFDDCSVKMEERKSGFRAEHGLPDSWPTFSDAEVQVIGAIDPREITAAWVENPEDGEVARARFVAAGREDCEVLIEPFQPRICRKPYFWG